MGLRPLRWGDDRQAPDSDLHSEGSYSILALHAW